MISRSEVFSSVYRGYRNKLTPHLYGYYGSLKNDGMPHKSRFICELSEGIYEGTPIYGVTVIEYDTRAHKWKMNFNLSGVTTSKDKAKKYARELGFNGCLIAGGLL